MKYAWIDQQRRRYPVTISCRVLGVSRSGYYEWRGRPSSHRVRADRRLLEYIRHIHRQGRENYGTRKVYWALRAEGSAAGATG